MTDKQRRKMRRNVKKLYNGTLAVNEDYFKEQMKEKRNLTWQRNILLGATALGLALALYGPTTRLISSMTSTPSSTIVSEDTITFTVNNRRVSFSETENPDAIDLVHQIAEIDQRIREIEENNLWVIYTVAPGQTISHLASLASGSAAETIAITNEIMEKNNLSNSFIRDGQQLEIMNPDLGQWKKIQNEIIDEILAETQVNNDASRNIR